VARADMESANTEAQIVTNGCKRAGRVIGVGGGVGLHALAGPGADGGRLAVRCRDGGVLGKSLRARPQRRALAGRDYAPRRTGVSGGLAVPGVDRLAGTDVNRSGALAHAELVHPEEGRGVFPLEGFPVAE